MLKLYNLRESRYWETWDNEDGSHTVHWGTLGTQGQSKSVRRTLFKKAESIIQSEIDSLVKDGFVPIDPEDHSILLIEYKIDNMGATSDLDKRYALEDRMNETLGWTGLGNCDGGSIGPGTMEVCCFVVDFDIAKTVIEDDLADTDYSDYVRIYDESTDT